LNWEGKGKKKGSAKKRKARDEKNLSITSLRMKNKKGVQKGEWMRGVYIVLTEVERRQGIVRGELNERGGREKS